MLNAIMLRDNVRSIVTRSITFIIITDRALTFSKMILSIMTLGITTKFDSLGVKLQPIVFNVIMLSVSDDCQNHCDKCHADYQNYDNCHYVECQYGWCHIDEGHYEGCPYAECHNTECRYAAFHCAY